MSVWLGQPVENKFSVVKDVTFIYIVGWVI